MSIPQYELDNPFDLLAVLLRQLQTINSYLFSNGEARSAIVIEDMCRAEVEAFLTQHSILVNPRKLLREGLDRETQETIMSWKHYNTFTHVLVLLGRIESGLTLEELIDAPPIKNCISQEFSALNDNAEATGFCVLPKVDALLDSNNQYDGPKTRHFLRNRSNNMNNELRNLYFYPIDAANGFDIRNIVLPHIRTEDKEQLIIAASPVMREDPKLRENRYDVPQEDGSSINMFSIEDVGPEEEILARIKAIFFEACKQKADMLFFPELLGNRIFPGDQQDSQFLFDELIMLAHEAGYEKIPYLIIAPTRWANLDNQLVVFDGNADVLMRQSKQYPFNHEKAVEDLRNRSLKITILHIPGIGRLAFAICRDYLEPEFQRLLLEALQCTLLICPAFSPAKTAFEQSGEVSSANGCYCIWCNCCAAFLKEGQKPDAEHIGFLLVPGVGIKKFEPICSGACNGENTVCLFVTTIFFDPERSGAANVQHIWKNGS